MSTAQALLIVFIILLCGFLLLAACMRVAQKFMHKEISYASLLNGLNQKLWMTFGLGIFFFGSYLLLILLFSSVNSASVRLNIFHLAYQNPITAAYFGLGVFVSVSIGIYLVRKAIIRWYNNR